MKLLFSKLRKKLFFSHNSHKYLLITIKFKGIYIDIILFEVYILKFLYLTESLTDF